MLRGAWHRAAGSGKSRPRTAAHERRRSSTPSASFEQRELEIAQPKRTEKVDLAEVHAVVAQDGVRHTQMEIRVRHIHLASEVAARETFARHETEWDHARVGAGKVGLAETGQISLNGVDALAH